MIPAERHFLLKALKQSLTLGVILTIFASCAPGYQSEKNRPIAKNQEEQAVSESTDKDEPIRTIDIEEVVITAKKKKTKKTETPATGNDESEAPPAPEVKTPKTKERQTQVSADVNTPEKTIPQNSDEATTEKPPVVVSKAPIKEKPTPQVTEKADPISTKRKKELSFIRTAYDVIMKESKKLGTACNRFIMRVLQLTGFSTEGFVANDFDIYAKKNLKNYRAVKFTDTKELERHLNSYPERTPFILQWERDGKHGHIALVERSNSKLYSYESSLNSFHPRVKETTVNKLINLNSRKQVIVYSDFIQ